MWRSDGCVRLNYTADSVTCACTHLTDFGSKLAGTLGSAGAVLGSAGDLTLADLLENLVVIATVATMYSCGLFLCVYGRYADDRDNEKLRRVGPTTDEADAESAKRLQNEASRSSLEKSLRTALGGEGNEASVTDERGRIKAFVEWWDGVKREHKVVSIVYSHDPVFTRPQRITVLMLFLFGTMFGNAILFDVNAMKDCHTGITLLATQSVHYPTVPSSIDDSGRSSAAWEWSSAEVDAIQVDDLAALRVRV
jgi:hypothetical protein